MPVELPEDTPEDTEKKWRYRKETATPMDTHEEVHAVEEEEEGEPPHAKVTSLNSEISKTNHENVELSKQITVLTNQVKQITTTKDEFSNQISMLTEQLKQSNTENEGLREQINNLEEKLQQVTEQEKEKTKKLKKLNTKLSDSETQISKLQDEMKQVEKTSKEREEHLLSQLEAMAEQIGKLREVIKKRDEELVALQKDILVKKGVAKDAQEEADQLRMVGIVQREAVQDTTVLRRRVTDLEVELEQLKKTLEKDPKYRIYILVRETGQRTLEELSKILGVGLFEARRRVQELVRAGLLELKEDKVHLSRRGHI